MSANTTTTQTQRRHWWRWLLIGLLLVILVAAGAFTAWAYSVSSMPEAQDALVSTDGLTVTTDEWISFMPDEAPQTGFIFYPGGRVPADAYAPLARQIAAEGYLVVIPYVPLRLAITTVGAADAVMEQFSGIEYWVVGGHSLGGATAAIYTNNNPDKVDGLIFLASYPADDTLAARDDLPVLSIYGSEDGVASADFEASAADLPADAQLVLIEGANHAQFGYYGEQSGDGEATITREEQITRTRDLIVEFLGTIGE